MKKFVSFYLDYLLRYNSDKYFIRMKRENCIEVKYVNNLSVAYLTRFFGSVGPVIKVEKEEVSKYVTIVRFPGFSNLRIKIVLKGPFASMAGLSTNALSKSGSAGPHPLTTLHQKYNNSCNHHDTQVVHLRNQHTTQSDTR